RIAPKYANANGHAQLDVSESRIQFRKRAHGQNNRGAGKGDRGNEKYGQRTPGRQRKGRTICEGLRSDCSAASGYAQNAGRKTTKTDGAREGLQAVAGIDRYDGSD